MTAVDVDALDKLREAATAGPWIPMLGYDSGRVVTDTDGESVAHYVSTADAALIVAAVNALPALLAEVRRGRALRERLEGLAEEWDQTADRYLVLSRDAGMPPEHKQRAWDQYLTLQGASADLRRAVVAAVDGGEGR